MGAKESRHLMDTPLHDITNSLLLDNSSNALTMVNAIKVLAANPACRTLQIATGYWDIPGTTLVLAALQDFLRRDGTRVQLLIGADPVVRISQLKHPMPAGSRFPQDYIRRDIHDLEVTDDYVATVRFIMDYCHESEADSRLQIRIYKTDDEGNVQFFHAKCYIFLGNDFAKGIIGSSNFTQKGLEGNSELNYLEWDNTKVTAVPNAHSSAKGHERWFEEKWNLSTSWNKTLLEEVLHGAPIVAKAKEKPLPKAIAADSPLTPYELYIKLLNYKFGDIIDLNQQQLIESYLPKRYKPLDYQLQAVRQCFAIMREHGGFMLADVVGLGKTIVGMLIVKHFLRMPDEDGRERKVLVITPPAIQTAWRHTMEEFDRDTNDKAAPFIDYITTGSIGNLMDDYGVSAENDDEDTGEFLEHLPTKNYGLILIDESHKFRNSQTDMYIALTRLIGVIGQATGCYPYVGLLSATPQNNRPADIQNQIYLFERNRSDSTLKKALGGNLEGFFSQVNRKYGELIAVPRDGLGNIIQLTPEEKKQRGDELKQLSQQLRDCVLEDILVRRTRTDIIKYYHGALKFPVISGPHSLEYKMEEGLATLFADTMNLIAPSVDIRFAQGGEYLCYYRYRAIEFLKDPETKNLYKGGNIDPDRFSQQLARIMQMNLVKRIESSFSAFKQSLANLRQYTQNMVDMWEANTIFICPEIDVNAELDREKRFEKTQHLCAFEECVADLREKIRKLDQKGKNQKGRNREMTRDDFQPEYIACLRHDLAIIDFLCRRWNAYSNDPKLEEFKRSLMPTLFDKKRNPTQKLVIFSEAIDTVETIALAVKSVAPQLSVISITAANRDDKEQTIRENFDANYDGEWRDDYQVIVTTEVLAEGVNLHRANTILNYDTPWNATRLMQRIGRVNRIGSQADTVYVYNFMPSAQGDAQIQLVQKAYTKLQSFHTLFGEDNQVFTEAEEVVHYDLNMQVNGEESPMERYISELKNYKEAHPDRFALIAAKEDGLDVAAPTADGHSYFLVRNKRVHSLFVEVDKDCNAHIIPAIDMYRRFRTDPAEQPCPLPDDWQRRKHAAELVVNQYLTRLNRQGRNSPKATDAKALLTRMNEQLPLSAASRSIVEAAFQMVNKGNIDIINKVLALGTEMENQQLSLFAMTQEEIDDVLEREIKRIVSNVERRFGKAEAYIGLSK